MSQGGSINRELNVICKLKSVVEEAIDSMLILRITMYDNYDRDAPRVPYLVSSVVRDTYIHN